MWGLNTQRQRQEGQTLGASVEYIVRPRLKETWRGSEKMLGPGVTALSERQIVSTPEPSQSEPGEASPLWRIPTPAQG